MGGLAAAKGDFEDEMRYRKEALEYSDLATSIRVIRGIAVVKAKEGFHKSAARDLEKLVPLLRYTQAPASYEILNSLAVEFGEIGRIEEAQSICRITLASPYAFAYPEWRETGQDLALRGYKSRSSVPIIRKIPVVRRVPGNVLYMSERERSEGHRRSPFDLPRDISILAEWKKKMVKEKGKEPNGKENGEQTNTDEMSDKDLLFEIMNIASEDSITREQLQEILDAARRIVSKKP